MDDVSATSSTLASKTHGSFADYLIEQKLMTEAALKRAINSANETQSRLVPILSKLGILSENEILRALSAYYRLPIIKSGEIPTEALFADTINHQFLKNGHILPLADTSGSVEVAMVDPSDTEALEAIQFFTGKPTSVKLATLTDIQAALDRLYFRAPAPLASDTQQGAIESDLERLNDLASDAPIIRLVHNLTREAGELGASDIHIEALHDRTRVRLRIDGFLKEHATYDKQTGLAVISRIKVLAQLNIAEKRLPQDGRFRFTVRGHEIDVRASTCPTVHGESVVLRLLNREATTLDFKLMGFDEPLIESFQQLLKQPHGIILVTGPTGSGKTTTLYTALSILNAPEKKILTIEDPVEYQLDGINQQEVLSQINRGFAQSLRSFLRQDPDIIMVGEIRDSETAETAVQASLTGHLILTTLHTNSAAGAITRLMDMGIEDYLLSSTLVGVLGQRLIRCLCPACKVPYSPPPELCRKLSSDMGKDIRPGVQLYQPRGCKECHQSGYKGRTVIGELLVVDEAMRRQILQKSDASGLQKTAVSTGMRTMYQHGLDKVLNGITSFEELLRIIREAE